jgi:hypothetical protein
MKPKNRYSGLSVAQLRYIIDDSGAAMRLHQNSGNRAPESGQLCESKYADQVNDACSELYRRSLKTLKGE